MIIFTFRIHEGFEALLIISLSGYFILSCNYFCNRLRGFSIRKPKLTSMKYLHFPRSLEKQPIRLNEEELENPISVVQEFFTFYNLNHTRLEIAEWLALAQGSDEIIHFDAVKRSNLIQFSYQLEALIEAVYLLYSKSKVTAQSVQP